MNCPNTECQAPLAALWTRCGVCGHQKEEPSPAALIADYRAALTALQAWRKSHFPRGSFVHVDRVGVGVVSHDHECPPDMVAVLLGNGNVWFYAFDRVHPSSARRAGYSLRKLWLRRHKYELLPMARPRDHAKRKDFFAA